MQDHFLFDDDDAKQRGRGCDRLGTKKDGCALRWTWDKYGKKRIGKPNQCCYAEVGKGWQLEVTFWHTMYEAEVRQTGEHVKSFRKEIGDRHPGAILVTRLQAQLKAESLLLDVWNDLDRVIRKHKIHAKKVVRALLTGKKEVA